MTTHSQTSIFLIEDTQNQIYGRKLPKVDALRILFYNLRKSKLDLLDNAKFVIEEVLIFWGEGIRKYRMKRGRGGTES